eukprot:5799850-Alexandrium_andersonii.AAC.1
MGVLASARAAPRRHATSIASGKFEPRQGLPGVVRSGSAVGTPGARRASRATTVDPADGMQ